MTSPRSTKFLSIKQTDLREVIKEFEERKFNHKYMYLAKSAKKFEFTMYLRIHTFS